MLRTPRKTAAVLSGVGALAFGAARIVDPSGNGWSVCRSVRAVRRRRGLASAGGLGGPPDDRPLYVGKAEDSLVTRDLRTHFATGRTGQSSPRRSLAALLVYELALVATPRRPADPEPDKWTQYALEPDGDERLTAWMRERLRLAAWTCERPVALGKLERLVMGELQPPLNLTGVSQPWSAQVRDARKAMARAAEEWARQRG